MVKSQGLLSTLAMSEKRLLTLLYVLEAPRKSSDIQAHLKVKLPEIAPRIKELVKTNLIYKDGDYYTLTTVGKVVMADYTKLLNTLETIESNETFWKTHDLSPIPDHLLYKLKNLHNCSFVQSALCNQFEPHKEFTYWVANSTQIRGMVGVFNPAWVPWFSEVSELDIPIELIVTKDVYEKIKSEYSNELAHGLQNKNAHIYVYDGELKVAASTMRTLEGTFFSFGLHFLSNGQYDNNLDLQGCDEESFRWGEEFFRWYKERSEEVLMEQAVSELVLSGEKSKVAEFEYI